MWHVDTKGSMCKSKGFINCIFGIDETIVDVNDLITV